MKPIRFGVMGCASIAKRMVMPAINEIETLDLVAVCSRDLIKSMDYASQFGCDYICGYENVLARDDIDAIYMPLPTGLHLEWGLKCIAAGKHLLIEKSLGANFSETLALVNAAKKRGVLIMENYMFEYHPQQNTVRTIIQSKLGEIRQYSAYFGFPPLPSDNFRYDKSLGGGALLDAGGYTLKSLAVFFPSYAPTLHASTLTYDPLGVDIAGCAMLTIRNDNEVIPVNLSFGFDNFYRCGIDVWGSKGRLTTNRTFTSGPDFVPTATLELATGIEIVNLPKANHFVNILNSFETVVRNGDFENEYDKILRQAELQQALNDLSH